MRTGVAAGAIAGLAGLGALAAIGGRSLGEPAMRFDWSAPEPASVPSADASSFAATTPGVSKEPADERFPTSAVGSDASGYERVAPRAPLSELSLAMPPEPKLSDEWEGTIIHRPIARSAGVIEAQGYTIAMAGTRAIDADERCTHEGRAWNCGLRARTAFRAFLRGRSPTCAIPPEAGREIMQARCRIGKQDLGEWLVVNGWAHAAAGGPYVEAGASAREKGLGIFGPPPDTSPVLVLPDAPLEETPSIEYLRPSDAVTPVLRQAPSE